ncbi:FIG00784346: hypothetical protein [hydrothermal vent metagenome]|uniref:AraC family transcriptional regulator n=1 Tax=hydrothermal vent metagenome TaxID=652676 RepID=A0A3B1A3R8_9ZZZZ
MSTPYLTQFSPTRLRQGLHHLTLMVLLMLCIGLPAVATGAPIGANSDNNTSTSTSIPAAEVPVSVPAAQAPADETAATSASSQPPAAATQPVPAEEKKRSLDARVQDLKKQAKALNRDLFILEEELLFPSNTQLAVFLSIDVGSYFRLDSVQLKINGKEVANHLYTKRELDALQRGGVQRLWLGNVKSGEHELIATFTGPGPNNRDYRRATTVKFKKGAAAKFMELKIRDVTAKLQPEFVVREWE